MKEKRCEEARARRLLREKAEEKVVEDVIAWVKVKKDQAKNSTRRCSLLHRSSQLCGSQQKPSLCAEIQKCMWSRGAASRDYVSLGPVGQSHVRHNFRGHLHRCGPKVEQARQKYSRLWRHLVPEIPTGSEHLWAARGNALPVVTQSSTGIHVRMYPHCK